MKKNIQKYEDFINENVTDVEPNSSSIFQDLEDYQILSKIADLANIMYDIKAFAIKDKHVSFPNLRKNDKPLISEFSNYLKQEYNLKVNLKLKESNTQPYWILTI